MVADHPPEPPALAALVSQVFADVGRGGDADFYVLRVAARLTGRVADVLHRPLQYHGVRELQDEAVRFASDEVQRFRTVAGHPHVKLAVFDPGDADFVAVRSLYIPSFGELFDDVHRLFELG